MERKEIAGYKIEGILGEGGMGVVYRGRDTTLNRPVAIKVIQANRIGEQGKQRFLREARACSAINHPNIITVYAAGEEDGNPYLAMELVDGQTLREIIDKGPMEWKKAIRCMVDLLDALDQLHDGGIVHRDLKPENIMVTREGTVKLMDFGLAHLQASSTLTEEGTALGTVPYMSPEQVMGNKADKRSDIFSIASVFHEMITGLHPFRGEHPMAVMYSIRNETPRALKLSSQDLPVGMQAVLDKAFEKEIDKRYQDASTFREELAAMLPEGALNGSRIMPAPGPASGRKKLMRFGFVFMCIVIALGGWYFLGPANSSSKARSFHENAVGAISSATPDVEKAREYLWLAIAEDEDYAAPWNTLANISLAEKDYISAESYIKQSLQLDPRYEEAMYNMGELKWATNDLPAARRWYEEAIETNPGFLEAYNNLGSLLRTLGENEAARDVLVTGLSQELLDGTRISSRVSMKRHRGLVAWSLGEADSALFYLRAVQPMYPDDPEIKNALNALSQ